MNDHPENLPEAAIVRDYFEALLGGCCAVGKSDAEAGRALLTSLRLALDGQANLIKSAIVADSTGLIELGLKPMSVMPLREGKLAIYKPVRTSRMEQR